ncbi:hypothetical protein DFH11DRAFT_1607425 [Phellopilus nigrolimitatus]|nr:hypothetical protein DFH11DRAFT_1607425 [Phellopilus nigrolimitatus]
MFSHLLAHSSRRQYIGKDTISKASSSTACFSTNLPQCQTHYDTLGVPRTASRMEIKSNYFDKKYHPDVNRDKDETAKNKFHEVSEAYAVLSSDREKRAYDRKLGEARTHSRAQPHSSTAGSTAEASRWAYEMHGTRKRGATHAWEGPRAYGHRAHQHEQPRHGQHSSHSNPSDNPYRPPGAFSASQSQTSGRHYDPSASSSSQSSSQAQQRLRPHLYPLAGRQAREEEERQLHDRLTQESNITRFLRALGIIIVVSWVGGGWGG